MLECVAVLKILQDLLELQSEDTRLNAVRANLAQFPKKLAEGDSLLAAAKAELDHSRAALLATHKDRKKYELDVDSWKERVRKYRDQTSQVKTNEAYKALQHEVQMAEDEIAKAEDRLLEQMVSSEEYDRKIKAAEINLKEVEAGVARERARIESERAGVEKELGQLTAARTRVVTEIPEDMLDHYERIAKKHNGVSLAEVHNETCGACGVRIRPHVFQEMRRSESRELFHCETCTRILYYIEPEPAPSMETPAVGEASAAKAASGAPRSSEG